MRKHLFIVVLALTALIAGLCGCGETAETPKTDGDSSVCEHTFGEWTVSSPATCEEDGTESRACTKCGKEESRSVPKTGHQGQPMQDVAPTCTEAGSVGGEQCKFCGKVLEEPTPVPMLGHSFGEWENAEEEGVMMHKRVCLRDESHVETAPCSFSHSPVPPTCESEGFTALHCTVCMYAENKTDLIPRLEHDFGEWIPNADGTHSKICKNDPTHVVTEPCSFEEIFFPADCEKEGYRLRVCRTCAAEYKDEFKDPLGHDYGAFEHVAGTNTHKAVCKNNSAHVLVEDCDYISTVVPATCEERGYTLNTCEKCQSSEKTAHTDPLGHHYIYETVAGTQTHRKVCTRDNTHVTEAEPCVFTYEVVEPTCTQEGFSGTTCVLCHNYTERDESTVKPALGHSYGDWISCGDGTHKRVCTRDGAEEHANCSFGAETTVAATCTAGGYTVKQCETCKFEQKTAHVPAKGHSYGAWTPNGDGTHSRTCGIDGEKETKSCIYRTESAVAATCTEGGYTVKVCTECAEKVHADEVPAAGHKWQVLQKSKNNATHEEMCMNAGCRERQTVSCSISESTVAPTCEEQGYDVNVCLVCENSFQDNFLPATEHQWLDTYYFESGAKQHYRLCKHNSLHNLVEDCSFSVTETKEPSCTEGGYTNYTCSVCKNSYADNVTPVKGHSFGEWTRKVIINDYHEHTCSVCGFSEQQKCEKYVMTRVEPTCTEDGYANAQCAVCGGKDFYETHGGSKTLPALGHHFGSWTDDGNGSTHSRTCTHDGCTEKETNAHDLVDGSTAATCGAAGAVKQVCKDCFYAKDGGTVGALGHQWKSKEHDGWVRTAEGKHARECTRCNFKEEGDCKYIETVDPATCTAVQQTTKTCEICGDVISAAGEALGHTWGTWSSTPENHSNKCSVCFKEVNEAHDFSKSNICVCGYDGLDYRQQDNYYVVIGDSRVGNAENIVIPATHDGLPVKGIEEDAFMNGKLKTLTIPKSIEKIGEFAFYTSALESVTISEEGEGDAQLKEIGRYAFGSNRKLVEFKLPASLETIGEFAFYDCTAFADIDVPEHATLGMRALYNTKYYQDPQHWDGEYTALYIGTHLVRVNPLQVGSEFTIKEGTTIVCANAFDGCKELKKLTVPETVKEFRTDAFLNCTNLDDVTFEGSLEDWLKIVYGNDHASPLCYNADVLQIGEATGEIKIPEGTTSIPAGTFRNTTITKVTIPSTVTSIGAGAFYGCKDLKTVDFSGEDNIVSVGKAAFYQSGIEADDSGYWKDDVLYVGKHLIKAKATVTSVKIKDDTATISPEAFKDCKELTEIEVPNSLRWIGERAFEGCTQLKTAKFAEKMDFLATQLKADGSYLISRHAGSGDTAEMLAYYLREHYLGTWKRY